MRIKDIAKEINISATTISRVLNKKEGNYSEKTKNIVLEALKKYNYTPDMIARNLKRKRTFDIGILIPEFSFYSEIYHDAQKAAKKHGYNVLLVCSNYNKDYERMAIIDFLERKVAGLIITTGFSNYSYLSEYENKDIPVVTLEKISEDAKLPVIFYNNSKILKIVINHLIENDYKNPALVIGSTDYLYNAKKRIEAFKNILNKYNIKFNEDNIIADKKINYFDPEAAIKLLDNLMKKRDKPDSLLISKDILAIIMINRLIKEGYKIPEDIGIVGFDNIALSKYINPSLTCVDIPISKFGNQAVELLIKLIEKKKINNTIIEFEPNLIIRNSTNRKNKTIWNL